MEKTTIGEKFHPEKYCMIFCSCCNGTGKSFNDAKGIEVCKVCGGFGLIKKIEKNSFHNIRLTGQWVR